MHLVAGSRFSIPRRLICWVSFVEGEYEWDTFWFRISHFTIDVWFLISKVGNEKTTLIYLVENSVRSSFAKSVAFCPRTPFLNAPRPTRSTIASNSASVSRSAPSEIKRSRGLSFTGQFLILSDFISIQEIFNLCEQGNLNGKECTICIIFRLNWWRSQ